MRVLVAKGLSLVLASVVITFMTLAVSVIFGIALIRSQDGNVTFTAQFWEMVAASVVAMAAYGVIGVAVGALVPNQIAAVVGVLIWMLAIEQMVIPLFPEVGRWMPFAAASSLMQLGSSYGDQLLSVALGGLVLFGYTAVTVVLTLLVTPRRDVL
jgi:hypothetical protein